jgi:hypothetical protein
VPGQDNPVIQEFVYNAAATLQCASLCFNHVLKRNKQIFRGHHFSVGSYLLSNNANTSEVSLLFLTTRFI